MITDYDLFGGHSMLWQPVLIYRNRACVVRMSEGPHQFGGEIPSCNGLPDGAKIHLLMELDLADGELLHAETGMSRVPLVFPFMHDGGEIKYRLSDDGGLSILEISPEEADEYWPYENYPDQFHSKSMKLTNWITLEDDEVESLCYQGIDRDDDTLVALIPPDENFGVSLWGEGDDEGVLCVFTVNLRTGIVSAENWCT